MNSTILALTELKNQFQKKLIRNQKNLVSKETQVKEAILDINYIRNRLNKPPLPETKVYEADYVALNLDNYLENFPLLCAKMVLE